MWIFRILTSIAALNLVVLNLGFSVQKDLLQYIEQVSNQTQADAITPLPELKMVKVVGIHVTNLRNPFNTPDILRAKDLPGGVENNKQYEPDLARRKSPLEQIALENLKFSGVIEQSGRFWAIITNVKNQHANIVQVGDYVGRDYGRVEKITAKYVEIDERKKGKEGQWRKISTFLNLDQVK